MVEHGFQGYGHRRRSGMAQKKDSQRWGRTRHVSNGLVSSLPKGDHQQDLEPFKGLHPEKASNQGLEKFKNLGKRKVNLMSDSQD